MCVPDLRTSSPLMETSFLGCRRPPPCMLPVGCVLISSSYKRFRCFGLELTLMTLFYRYLFKDPVAKYSHILRYWGGELWHQCMNFRGYSRAPKHGSNV